MGREGGGRRSDYTVSFISIMFSIHHTFRPKENWKEYLKSSLNNKFCLKVIRKLNFGFKLIC